MPGSTPAPRCPAAGATSDLLNGAHQLGGSLGLTILVTVFASAERGAAATCRPGTGAHAQSVHELANGVATGLSGSVVLLAPETRHGADRHARAADPEPRGRPSLGARVGTAVSRLITG
jgi:hypothetical protein